MCARGSFWPCYTAAVRHWRNCICSWSQALKKFLTLEEPGAAEAPNREASPTLRACLAQEAKSFPLQIPLTIKLKVMLADRKIFILKSPDLFSQSRNGRWTWRWEAIIQLLVYYFSFCNLSANPDSHLVFILLTINCDESFLGCNSLLNCLDWILRNIQKMMFAIQENTVLTVRQNAPPTWKA